MECGGPIDKLEMECLKLKVGTGTMLEDNFTHNQDINMFSLSDIIAGPLEVNHVKGSTMLSMTYSKKFVILTGDCMLKSSLLQMNE